MGAASVQMASSVCERNFVDEHFLRPADSQSHHDHPNAIFDGVRACPLAQTHRTRCWTACLYHHPSHELCCDYQSALFQLATRPFELLRIGVLPTKAEDYYLCEILLQKTCSRPLLQSRSFWAERSLGVVSCPHLEIYRPTGAA